MTQSLAIGPSPSARGARPASLALVAAFGAAFLAMTAEANADTIRLLAGSEIKDVDIVEAKWDSISYKYKNAATGSPQVIEGTKVDSIDRPPARITAVKGFLESGDFVQADKSLASALASGPDWEQAEASYLKGKVYLEWSGQDPSKLPVAIATLEEYLKKYKSAKEFNVPPAVFVLGNAYLADKKFKEATDQFKALAEFGEKGVWGWRSKIGQAYAILREKGEQGALDVRKLFGDIINDKSAPATLRAEAAVGRAETYIVQKQFDETIKELTEVVFEQAGSTVAYDRSYGEACNLMGDAYRGKKDLAEAEIWYLKTTCFFRRYPALYRAAAKNLVEIYKETKRADRQKEWEARASG